MLVLMAFVKAYPVARLYALVEAFASLRSPPVGTYRTQEWAKEVPQFAADS